MLKFAYLAEVEYSAKIRVIPKIRFAIGTGESYFNTRKFPCSQG